MNREILFRGKRKSQYKDFDGEWVYGDLFHNLVYDGRENEVRIGDVYFDKDTNDEIHGTGCVLVYSDTLGEYTGLTDKNGKKIFEGDILKARHNGYPYLVSYDECRFKIEDKWGNRIKMTQDAINWLEVELVGNIHDNPELLAEKS